MTTEEAINIVLDRKRHRTMTTPEPVLQSIANHQSHRAEYGLSLTDYSKHADAMVRWAADFGRREGEWLLAQKPVKKSPK